MKKFILLLITICYFPIFGFNNIAHTKFSSKIIIPKIILLAGPSGSGKGTFGDFLQKIDQIYKHIDSGAIVRREIAEKTNIGLEIKPIYESGEYLSGSLDEIVWEKLIKKRLEYNLEQNKIAIVDGCLRSEFSFELLNKFIENKKLIGDTILVQLIAGKQTCLKRILTRRVCSNPECSKIYNIFLPEYELLQNSKKNENFNTKLCPCGSEIISRNNDTGKIAIERRAHFDQETEPLLELIKNHYKSIEINTECDIESLQEQYKEMFYTGAYCSKNPYKNQ